MLDSNKKSVWRMRPLVVGALVASIILIVGLVFWLLPSEPWTERVKMIRVGASKEDVQKIMGKPTAILLPATGTNRNIVSFLLGVDSETWAYGQSLCQNPTFPYITPRLRLFQPDMNDVSIVFDSNGKVVSVHIPDVETTLK